MQALTDIERDVLNALADDAEDLERIYLHLKSTGEDVPLSVTADAVRSLVEKGFLSPRMDENGHRPIEPSDPSCVWRARFAVTSPGREAWAASENAPPPSPAPRRSLQGLWKDLGVPPITAEEIAEARREMWGSFPRDFPR